MDCSRASGVGSCSSGLVSAGLCAARFLLGLGRGLGSLSRSTSLPDSSLLREEVALARLAGLLRWLGLLLLLVLRGLLMISRRPLPAFRLVFSTRMPAHCRSTRHDTAPAQGDLQVSSEAAKHRHTGPCMLMATSSGTPAC